MGILNNIGTAQFTINGETKLSMKGNQLEIEKINWRLIRKKNIKYLRLGYVREHLIILHGKILDLLILNEYYGYYNRRVPCSFQSNTLSSVGKNGEWGSYAVKT